MESPCIACGESLKNVPRGQNCPACGVPWTSPMLRCFWRVQVIGAVPIPLMLFVGAVWLVVAESRDRDWPGRLLLAAFALAVLHLVAGIVWNTMVPEYHRPRNTGRIVGITLIVIVLAGILLPAMGKC